MRFFFISAVILWMNGLAVAVSPWLTSKQMTCTYGPRGSLSAYCYNATSNYFVLTPYRFDNLDETLVCVNCNLASLSAGTFDIKSNQIRTLDIRNSSIRDIYPKAFVGLVFMERLLISNNPISSIWEGAFTGIRKLKYIEMQNTTSHLNPYVFKELRELEILDLGRNKLTELSSGTFEGLSNLKLLLLGSNQLTTLSDDCFLPLTSLISLELQDNRLSKINGNEFRTLLSLLKLNLENNWLLNFTLNIDSSNKLRNLNLAKNFLTTDGFKTGTFSNLSELQDLNLSQNLINKIPSKFFQGLFKLTHLNLHANLITEFSTGSFSGLPHLRILNISNNFLETAKVTGHLILPSLHTLDLSNNKIKDFDYIAFIATMPRISNIILLNSFLPCETAEEIETLFKEDHLNFYISYKDNKGCVYQPGTTKEIINKILNEKYNSVKSNALHVVWAVLICLIIVLVLILFYIQFFVLNRTHATNFKVHIFNHPRSSV